MHLIEVIDVCPSSQNSKKQTRSCGLDFELPSGINGNCIFAVARPCRPTLEGRKPCKVRAAQAWAWAQWTLMNWPCMFRQASLKSTGPNPYNLLQLTIQSRRWPDPAPTTSQVPFKSGLHGLAIAYIQLPYKLLHSGFDLNMTLFVSINLCICSVYLIWTAKEISKDKFKIFQWFHFFHQECSVHPNRLRKVTSGLQGENIMSQESTI